MKLGVGRQQGTSRVKWSNRHRAAEQRAARLGAKRSDTGSIASICNDAWRPEAQTSGGAFRPFHSTNHAENLDIGGPPAGPRTLVRQSDRPGAHRDAD